MNTYNDQAEIRFNGVRLSPDKSCFRTQSTLDLNRLNIYKMMPDLEEEFGKLSI